MALATALRVGVAAAAVTPAVLSGTEAAGLGGGALASPALKQESGV
jgi:hypothetical protein